MLQIGVHCGSSCFCSSIFRSKNSCSSFFLIDWYYKIHIIQFAKISTHRQLLNFTDGYFLNVENSYKSPRIDWRLLKNIHPAPNVFSEKSGIAFHKPVLTSKLIKLKVLPRYPYLIVTTS